MCSLSVYAPTNYNSYAQNGVFNDENAILVCMSKGSDVKVVLSLELHLLRIQTVEVGYSNFV